MPHIRPEPLTTSSNGSTDAADLPPETLFAAETFFPEHLEYVPGEAPKLRDLPEKFPNILWNPPPVPPPFQGSHTPARTQEDHLRLLQQQKAAFLQGENEEDI